MKCKLRLGMSVIGGEFSPPTLESNLYVSLVPNIRMY